MPVTLTDEQAAEVRARVERADRLQAEINRIWTDPKTADRAKALWKEHHPDQPIEGWDDKQEILARLDREKAEREEAEAKRRQEREDRRLREQRAATQKKYGFTDEGMKELEDLMVARNIGDYEVGATYLASTKPQPAEETGGGQDHWWHHDRSDEFQEIVKDPEAWGFNQIKQAVIDDAKRRGIK